MLNSREVLGSIVADEEGRPIFFDSIYERFVSRMPEGSRMANKATAKKILGSHSDIQVNKRNRRVMSYQSIDHAPPPITITETVYVDRYKDRYVDKIVYKKQWAWAPYHALATLVVIGAIAGYFYRGL